MALDAGQLDRQLQLLARAVTRDAVGQPVETWTATATVWAQRLNLTAADMARGAGRQTVPEGKYRIRYRADVTASMRVRDDTGAEYLITAIDQPDRRQTLTLTLQGASSG